MTVLCSSLWSPRKLKFGIEQRSQTRLPLCLFQLNKRAVQVFGHIIKLFFIIQKAKNGLVGYLKSNKA